MAHAETLTIGKQKMAKRRDVKEDIARAYMERAAHGDRDKIRVLDLVEEVGVNKNTFYYHFASRQSVAYWIIRKDIAQVIEENFDPEYHVFVNLETFPEKKDAFADLPYYVRVPRGARMLDQGAFIKLLVMKLRENQAYYRSCFQGDNIENTSNYLDMLYRPAMLEDVDFIADGRYIPSATKDFLASCMMNINFGIIKDFACKTRLPKGLFDDEDNPFWNYAAESLHEGLRSHPIMNRRYMSGKLGFF